MRYKRRRLIGISSVGTILVLIFYFYPTIMSIVNSYSHGSKISINPVGFPTERVSKDSPIIAYLNNSIENEGQFKTITEEINSKTKLINMSSFDSRKSFVDYMNSTLPRLQEVVNNQLGLFFPHNASDYRNMVLSKNQKYYEAMNQYNIGVAHNDGKAFDNYKRLIGEYNKINAKIKNVLIKLFNDNNIRYEENQDGTLRFWYNE